MKDSKMQKVNTREKEGRHLTSENKRLSDINSANYEKFKKRRITLKKIFSRLLRENRLQPFCILAMKPKGMVTYHTRLDVIATFII